MKTAALIFTVLLSAAVSAQAQKPTTVTHWPAAI
jgi:hypothetical protein